jgi:hypothetical protein
MAVASAISLMPIIGLFLLRHHYFIDGVGGTIRG